MAIGWIPEEVRGLFFALAEARAGDEVPLQRWYAASFPLLARALGSEDLAATVVSKAFEFAVRGGTVANELAWMARVASNAEIDERRSRIGDPIGSGQEPATSDRLSVEEMEEALRLRTAITAAFLGLRSPYRDAMIHLYVEGWSRGRVVAFLMETRGIHETGAKQILVRGHAMLRKVLRRELGPPHDRP